MKFYSAIAAASLAVLGAVSAQAQTLPFSLVITKTNLPGNFITGGTIFSGDLVNTSATGTSPFTIDGSGLTATTTNGVGNVVSIPSYDVQGDLDFTDLFNASGNPLITLGPGGSHHFDDLFELNLNGVTNYSGTYVFQSGNLALATTFGSSPSAVPEPGSIALLTSGLIGGGLFVARRRRK